MFLICEFMGTNKQGGIDELLADEERLNQYARDLEVIQEKGESPESFRERVATAFMERYNDPIGAAEILFRKLDYHDFNKWEDDAACFLTMNYNRHREREMNLQGDTFYNMTWKYYQEILASRGFAKVYSENFKGMYKIEEFSLWFDPKRAILLQTETWDGKKKVNSTQIYYELLFPKPIVDFEKQDDYRDALVRFLCGSSNSPLHEKGKYIGRSVNHDGKVGLVRHLEELEKGGFITGNPWRDFRNHFLYFLNHTEEENDVDYRTRTLQKLMKLPKDVREKIGLTSKVVFLEYAEAYKERWFDKSQSIGKWNYVHWRKKGIFGKALGFVQYLLPT